MKIYSRNNRDCFAIVEPPQELVENWKKVGVGKLLRGVFFLTGVSLHGALQYLKRHKGEWIHKL